ncbi:hypothetical protein SBA3_540014 [Candidatus Sulfopaludibacter sp. SbA3]|nr:hypothetical protein SBA3_540014 [Candidatus Sulfopaludibacter sp. SbA3]
MELEKIQQEIRNQNLDGWLFFDHHYRDPLAYRVLGLPAASPTRRWYYASRGGWNTASSAAPPGTCPARRFPTPVGLSRSRRWARSCTA